MDYLLIKDTQSKMNKEEEYKVYYNKLLDDNAAIKIIGNGDLSINDCVKNLDELGYRILKYVPPLYSESQIKEILKKYANRDCGFCGLNSIEEIEFDSLTKDLLSSLPHQKKEECEHEFVGAKNIELKNGAKYSKGLMCVHCMHFQVHEDDLSTLSTPPLNDQKEWISVQKNELDLLRSTLSAAKCPNCDGSGQVEPDGHQCEWCYYQSKLLPQPPETIKHKGEEKP